MKRLSYIDIAKGFAIFFIVLGHAIVHSLNSHIAFNIIYSFHVPLFFIISGFTFESINKGFLNFVKNKFVRLLVPYFIWSVLFLIPYYLFGGSVDESFGNTGSFSLINNLCNILYGVGVNSSLKQNTPLWFLPALFSMEFIFYFICKIQGKKKHIFILIFLFFISIFSYKYITFIFPFGLNTVLNLGIFFYFGYLMKKYNIVNKYYKKNYLLIAFLLIGISFGIINESISCVDYYYGNIFMFYVTSFFLSLFVIFISKLMVTNKEIEYVGKNTMGILIFHKLIIVIFQNKIPFINSYLRDSSPFIELLLGILISIITIIICLLIIRIIRLMKMNFLLGEKTKVYTDSR